MGRAVMTVSCAEFQDCQAYQNMLVLLYLENMLHTDFAEEQSLSFSKYLSVLF